MTKTMEEKRETMDDQDNGRQKGNNGRPRQRKTKGKQWMTKTMEEKRETMEDQDKGRQKGNNG